MSNYNQLTVQILDGKIAPRYPESVKELTVKKAVITTQGTVGLNPIVDIQVEDEEGNKFFLSMTGDIFINLGAAVEGAGHRQPEGPSNTDKVN